MRLALAFLLLVAAKALALESAQHSELSAKISESSFDIPAASAVEAADSATDDISNPSDALEDCECHFKLHSSPCLYWSYVQATIFFIALLSLSCCSALCRCVPGACGTGTLAC